MLLRHVEPFLAKLPGDQRVGACRQERRHRAVAAPAAERDFRGPAGPELDGDDPRGERLEPPAPPRPRAVPAPAAARASRGPAGPELDGDDPRVERLEPPAQRRAREAARRDAADVAAFISEEAPERLQAELAGEQRVVSDLRMRI